MSALAMSPPPGDDCFRFELEDENTYRGYLDAHSSTSRFWHDSSVDLFEIKDGRAKYLLNLDDAALADHLPVRSSNQDSQRGPPSQLMIVIVKLDEYPTAHDRNEQYRLRLSSKLMEQLVEAFHIPHFWVSAYLGENLVQFSKVVDCCLVERDSIGPSHLHCFYRYHNAWRSMEAASACVFFGYNFKTQQSTYILVNAPLNAVERLQAASGSERLAAFAARPLLVNALILDESLAPWTAQAKELRIELTRFEKDEGVYLPKQLPKTSAALHQLARRWNILEEDLNNFEDKISFLNTVDNRFLEVNSRRCRIDGQPFHEPSIFTGDSLDCIGWRLRYLRRWVANWRRRTDIRINLVFNRSAQTDSRTNLTIAAQTGKIARESQRDSISMITIAAVTLFFLPGTFVSTLFSMVFFSFSPLEDGTETFRVSRLSWLYFAITVPLTTLVLGIWFAWRRWQVKEKGLAARSLDEKAAWSDEMPSPP